MTQVATVEKILDGTHAEISVARQSACGHDCAECAGCGVTGNAIHARALNTAGAAVGQKVMVESSTRNLLGIVLLVYLVPVVLFLTGYLATGFLASAGLRYLVAVVAFAAGLIPAVAYDRHLKKQGGLSFTIVRLL